MSLAQRQADLVAALVAGAPTPPGFSEPHLAAARAALLAKRAREVARVWPALSGAYGTEWIRVFGQWAQAQPPQGALRDGWDFAMANRPAPEAVGELRVRQALWVSARGATLRRRRLPAVRTYRDGAKRKVIVQVAGRIFLLP